MGRASAWALAGLLLSASSAYAQTGQTAQIPLQFDFLNPGARSLALGSAFVAVADDATAAFTNPAGLTLVPRREVSAEIRVRQLNTPYLRGGRLSGVPSGNLPLDTVAGPIYGTSPDLAVRPYFLSFVYPHGDWSAAVYRHELVLQSNTFTSEGPFYRSTSSGFVFDNSRLPGLSGARDIRIVMYGGGFAYHLSYRLSLGATVTLSRFSLASDFGALSFSDLYGPVDRASKGQSSTTTQSGAETRPALNLGALVTVTRKLRFGGVYRQGASFPFTHITNVPGTPTSTRIGDFQTPWVIGGGVRLEATPALALALDVDRVRYSRLSQDFITFQVDPTVASRVAIEDGTEVHAGMEYTLLKKASKPVIRAGAWFDPNHTVHYTTNHSFSDDDIRLQAVFPGGRSVWHYCAGFGMPLSRAYEFNIGADITSGRRYVSTSLVARFGK